MWVPGCSTGEEAYAIGILLAEHIQKHRLACKLQVFATDIDAGAIATARAGVYPAGIAADVPAERLAQFFTEEPGGGAYRVRQSLRDLLVFSEQDLLRDPPFSRIDLVSCRNLLIYLSGELQQQVIPLFHYALNPGGFLFLGTSETIGEFGGLFSTVDRTWKLFQRREHSQRVLPGALAQRPAWSVASGSDTPRRLGRAGSAERIPLREVTEQALLRHVTAVGALVNAQGTILYLHGRTGHYLEPTPGEAEAPNILKMARRGLRRELATALHKAQTAREVVRSPDLRVKTNGDYTRVDLTVRPVAAGTEFAPEALSYLVILEEAPERIPEPGGAEAVAAVPEGSETARIAALREDLRAKEEYLQTTIEELETSNEELRSSNEEMQSMNEEFQSANEELETSKEELQAVNEELATVNAELQTKVTDLSQANNDMNNLLAGTGIGTVFVDHQLRIVRFTPAVTRIINLIPSDLGRPVGHIVANLSGYDALVADTREVLANLIPKEIDVRTTEGRWFTMRIQPYRTLDNVIEGAVITFVDVTEVKATKAALERSETLLRTTQALTHVGGWEWNVESGTMYWTAEVYRLHDLAPDAVLNDAERMARSLEGFAPEDRPAVEAAFQRCLEAGVPYDLALPFTTSRGRRLQMRVAAEPVWEDGKVAHVVGFFMDLTGHEPPSRTALRAVPDGNAS